MSEVGSEQGASFMVPENSEPNPAMHAISRVAKGIAAPLTPEAAERMSDGVKGGMKYVQSNFEYDISIEDMAAVAGLSKFHFIRQFQKEMGKTPGTFLQHVRIFEAMKQLCETTDPVGRIGERVGYKDPAAFSRAFVRVAGIQPSRFREQMRRAMAAEHPQGTDPIVNVPSICRGKRGGSEDSPFDGDSMRTSQ